MRHPKWEHRLIAAVEQHRAKPFAWGESDCLMFVCACAEAVSGVDHAAQWRGSYADERGAARILLELGARDVTGALATVFKPKPVAQAKRGDIAVISAPTSQDPFGACGVFHGIGLVAVCGTRGVHLISARRAIAAFEVT